MTLLAPIALKHSDKIRNGARFIMPGFIKTGLKRITKKTSPLFNK
jgi:hypothetical protein